MVTSCHTGLQWQQQWQLHYSLWYLTCLPQAKSCSLGSLRVYGEQLQAGTEMQMQEKVSVQDWGEEALLYPNAYRLSPSANPESERENQLGLQI